MTDSNVASLDSRGVVVHGDGCTFAATESELSRMRLRMCAWCEARVRCVFGTGKRDVREIGTWEEV